MVGTGIDSVIHITTPFYSAFVLCMDSKCMKCDVTLLDALQWIKNGEEFLV